MVGVVGVVRVVRVVGVVRVVRVVGVVRVVRVVRVAHEQIVNGPQVNQNATPPVSTSFAPGGILKEKPSAAPRRRKCERPCPRTLPGP